LHPPLRTIAGGQRGCRGDVRMPTTPAAHGSQLRRAPGVFTAAILTFFFAWNEFVLALSLTSTTGTRTVPAQMAFFVGPDPFNPPYVQLATASVIVTIPVIVIVLLFQRRIVAGLTSGAVKG
jgi:multiple sugar transport system permease protein